MDLRTKKTSSELEKHKKSQPPKQQLRTDASGLFFFHSNYSQRRSFLSSLLLLLVLVEGNGSVAEEKWKGVEEWERNKEKQKQIQIQFFKDSVNNRYEINYHTAQPRYFVVCGVCVWHVQGLVLCIQVPPNKWGTTLSLALIKVSTAITLWHQLHELCN